MLSLHNHQAERHLSPSRAERTFLLVRPKNPPLLGSASGPDPAVSDTSGRGQRSRLVTLHLSGRRRSKMFGHLRFGLSTRLALHVQPHFFCARWAHEQCSTLFQWRCRTTKHCSRLSHPCHMEAETNPGTLKQCATSKKCNNDCSPVIMPNVTFVLLADYHVSNIANPRNADGVSDTRHLHPQRAPASLSIKMFIPICPRFAMKLLFEAANCIT